MDPVSSKPNGHGRGAPPTNVIRHTLERGGTVPIARRVYLRPGLQPGRLEIQAGVGFAELTPGGVDDLIRALSAWRADR